MEVRYSAAWRSETADTMHFLQQPCLLMTTKYRASVVDRYGAYKFTHKGPPTLQAVSALRAIYYS